MRCLLNNGDEQIRGLLLERLFDIFLILGGLYLMLEREREREDSAFVKRQEHEKRVSGKPPVTLLDFLQSQADGEKEGERGKERPKREKT